MRTKTNWYRQRGANQGRSLRRLIITAIVLAAARQDLPGGAQQTTDEAAQLFSKKCSGCHTVGKGPLVGPDLEQVASWTTSDLEKNIKRMEKMAGPLTDDEVSSLREFLRAPKVKERLKTEEKRAVAVATGTEPASADMGRKLFSGAASFKNGGPSCISCHQVAHRGGTMGRDLTDIYERLGEAALLSACEQPNFPAMKAIYSMHPLTKQEALHLTKYFGSLKDSIAQAQDPPVTELGLAAAVLSLGSLMFLYRKRKTGVRARLNRRG